MRTKLEKSGEESARLSHDAGNHPHRMPRWIINLEHYRLGGGRPRKEALRLMAKLEFFSLMDKMGLRREGDEPVEERPGRRGTDGNGRIAGGLC